MQDDFFSDALLYILVQHKGTSYRIHFCAM